MDNKEFKLVFGKIAKTHNFRKVFGGWYKESPECLALLELQKSNFGNYYQPNIKIFIQGVFGKTYLPDKNLFNNSVGHVNSGVTKDFRNVFDFDAPIDDNLRVERLREIFDNHIVPFTDKALSKSVIRALAASGQIILLPAIKEEFL